ncbi:cell division protein ZapE [Gordonia sp. (in: high G+C Gram-positive bacteria)]|uniref:cell division protein ZapE n=1 Tax=Gordonia sp. (in: high G+C Gram-positive bacteria) TaxID=84139 RepID=UPI0039E60CDE
MRRARRKIPTVAPGALIATAQAGGIVLDRPQRAACAHLGEARSVYLTGPAGRGKTALLDAYVTCLPAGSAVRAHWHEFIRDLHLNIRDAGGLAPAIDVFLGTAAVLAFDELHVDDPADGIFLHDLIERVVDRGVRLVVTSNDHPDDLMPNPLFHDAFTPTIDLLKRTCAVVDLDAGVDYRTHSPHAVGFAAGRWTAPQTARPGRVPVRIGSRSLTAWDCSIDHLGVTFDEICGRPLGATDYLALADRYSRWTISDVPDLVDADREAAQRFVHLVDVLYERDRPLTVECAVPRSRFATTGRPPTGAARMRSRLAALQ